jgi:hypothetical protein
MNAQRITARATMAAQPYREDLGAVLDGKRVWFGGAAIEECAKGHVSSPSRQEVDGILPYPPPRKRLGAKTNHLPNIQGRGPVCPLQDGPRNKNLDSK